MNIQNLWLKVKDKLPLLLNKAPFSCTPLDRTWNSVSRKRYFDHYWMCMSRHDRSEYTKLTGCVVMHTRYTVTLHHLHAWCFRLNQVRFYMYMYMYIIPISLLSRMDAKSFIVSVLQITYIAGILASLLRLTLEMGLVNYASALPCY